MTWRHAETTEPHPAQPDLTLLEEADGQVLAPCLACGQLVLLVNP